MLVYARLVLFMEYWLLCLNFLYTFEFFLRPEKVCLYLLCFIKMFFLQRQAKSLKLLILPQSRF